MEEGEGEKGGEKDGWKNGEGEKGGEKDGWKKKVKSKRWRKGWKKKRRKKGGKCVLKWNRMWGMLNTNHFFTNI